MANRTSTSLPVLEDTNAFDDEATSSRRSVWIAIAGGGLLVVGILLVWFLAFRKQTVEIPLVPPETASDTVQVQEPIATSTPTQEPTPTVAHAEPAPTPAPKSTSVAPPPSRPTPKTTPPSKPPKTIAKVEPPPAPKVVAPVLPPEGDPVRVMISSRPMGANIVIDGRPTGVVTPGQIVLRRIGKVELKLAGFHPAAKQIDPEDNPGRVEFQLQPNDGGNAGTGRIYLTSAPSGAEILMGGKNLGRTPRFVELPVGAQKLTLRSGPLVQTRTLEIRAGTNPSEHFGL
ncbi:MAG TPA: PEGA domain-containing protein [Fibrobacteria bacterium]|nr:PEGA domain-containing protein [Fibrobacteria bacterium]HOX50257.1 PEGA domain-containing protein [Fibrobacteria bacterium]